MTVKISSQRPLDEFDGLQDFEDQFLENQGGTCLIVATLGVQKVEHIVADGIDRPTVKMHHVEVVDGSDEELVRDILQRRLRERNGTEELAGLGALETGGAL